MTEKKNSKINDLKIEIENIKELEGEWILNQYQNVPALIYWTCPVCGHNNVRDCRYEHFEYPPLNNDFAVSLVCDNPTCQFSQVVLLNIQMSLELKEVAPMGVDEFEMLKAINEQDSRSSGSKLLRRNGRKGSIFISNKI